MEDVHNAGGVPAIINELLKKDGVLHPDRITVTGQTLRENYEGHKISNHEVIRPLDRPYDKEGGLSILYGNIAPDGAVIKVGGVDPSIKHLKVKRFVLIVMMKLFKPSITIPYALVMLL